MPIGLPAVEPAGDQVVPASSLIDTAPSWVTKAASSPAAASQNVSMFPATGQATSSHDPEPPSGRR